MNVPIYPYRPRHDDDVVSNDGISLEFLNEEAYHQTVYFFEAYTMIPISTFKRYLDILIPHTIWNTHHTTCNLLS